jgi:GNAT superfamily N-acetyltransferase
VCEAHDSSGQDDKFVAESALSTQWEAASVDRCKLEALTMHSIRPATPADIPLILELIRALAAYEREPDAVKTTAADLLRDGFGEHPRFECLIAENDHGEAAGFALYFYNYSTWRGRSGIHLEDLFVLPRFRGHGIGKALLGRVAARAVEQGCVRLQWDVLEWNQTAIDFYQGMGATFLDEWRIMRVNDEAIGSLAKLAPEPVS